MGAVRRDLEEVARGFGPALRSLLSVPVKRTSFFLLVVLFDFLFFFMHGLLVQPVLNRMLEFVFSALLLMSQGIVQGARSNMTLSSNPELMSAVRFSLLLGLVAFIIVCVVYLIFQSLAWWSAHRACGAPVRFVPFLRSFAKSHTLLWFPLFLLYQIISLLVALVTQVERRVDASFNATPMNVVLWTLIVFVVCVAMIQYVLLAGGSKRVNRSSFSMFFRRFVYILPAYLLLAGTFGAIIAVVNVTIKHLPIVGWVVLVYALALPFFALARIFFITWIDSVHAPVVHKNKRE